MNDNLVTNYTQLGIEKGLIAFSDDGKRIEYIEQNKSRNFDNPEEKVQAEAYCRLILEYGYPKQRVKLFVTVPMGVERKGSPPIFNNTSKKNQKIENIVKT